MLLLKSRCLIRFTFCHHWSLEWHDVKPRILEPRSSFRVFHNWWLHLWKASSQPKGREHHACHDSWSPIPLRPSIRHHWGVPLQYRQLSHNAKRLRDRLLCRRLNWPIYKSVPDFNYFNMLFSLFLPEENCCKTDEEWFPLRQHYKSDFATPGTFASLEQMGISSRGREEQIYCLEHFWEKLHGSPLS